MAVGDRREQLLDDSSCVFLFELAARDDLVKELAAVAAFRDQVDVLLLLKYLVETEDVGVR